MRRSILAMEGWVEARDLFNPDIGSAYTTEVKIEHIRFTSIEPTCSKDH